MSNDLTLGSAISAGIACRCPRCRTGKLFKGALSLDIPDACEHCGLEYKFVDSGDGPAVFAIILLGFLVLGMALIVEFRFSPPLWLHVVIWTPVVLFIALGLLRPLKALLIALQYKHQAAEGQLAEKRWEFSVRCVDQGCYGPPPLRS